jgi:hypothetical protein
MPWFIARNDWLANNAKTHFVESCNHRGEMVYRPFRVAGYICPCQRDSNPEKKGKTMAQKTLITVIWDFPMRIFNMARKKIEKILADRAHAEERWLNG